jgi:hypothetical protein
MPEPLHLLRISSWNYIPLFGAFQRAFEWVYGFELWQRGLSFTGLLVGMIAISSDPYWRSKSRRLERNQFVSKQSRLGVQTRIETTFSSMRNNWKQGIWCRVSSQTFF